LESVGRSFSTKFRNIGYNSGRRNRNHPGFKSLELRIDGYNIILETQLPHDINIHQAAGHFAQHVNTVLRNFPNGWSRMSEDRGRRSKPRMRTPEPEERPTEQNDDERLGAAFE
jgi:hypothetical protein